MNGMEGIFAGNGAGPGDSVALVERFVRRFLILPDIAYLPVVLWIIATHAAAAMECFPYLALLSPTKRCGKTRVLEILELLSANPYRGTSISPAALFRMLETPTTLLLDELETLNHKNVSETQQTILQILNAGHRKDTTVARCEGKKNQLRYFPVYGPKAFAAIRELPDTLLDRSIVVEMQRRLPSDSVERFLRAMARYQSEPLRLSLKQYAQEHLEDIGSAYEHAVRSDLKFLSDREADLWIPLFAICAVYAPDRIEELQRSAETLSRRKQAEDNDEKLETKLLMDLKTSWPEVRSWWETTLLIEELYGLPESPWREFNLNPRRLARMLRPFGVGPQRFRDDRQVQLRGYSRESLEVVWKRYAL